MEMGKDIASIPEFDINNISLELTPKAKEIMKKFKDKIFIIEKYNGEKYEEFIMTLIYTMLEGYEHEEFRNQPIMYKFKDDEKEQVKWLPFKHFIINTVFWNPMKWLDPDNLDESYIVPSSEMYKMTPIYIKEYMDDKYITYYNSHIPNMPNISIYGINRELNNIIGRTNFLFSRFSAYFSFFFGISSSIETFKDLADRIPEMNDVFYFKLDTTKQPAEMEQDLLDVQNKAVDLIMNDKEFNTLKPLLQPKAGLNIKQIRDMCMNIGMKPDQSGRTIPTPINTNFLIGGLQNPVDYYIGAIPGRKAAIINNEYLGKTGHLLILIAISTASVRLSRTVMDCHSPNPIPVDITSKDHLKKLDGRKYRFRGEKQYRQISAKDDNHLIGETVYMRSPITCCAVDGVCKECYGNLYYTNIDNYATGVFSATYVMNPVVQGILSAKHHQTTNTTKIEFPIEFFNFFDIYSTDIIINPVDDVNIMDYCLIIRREDIHTEDDNDDELDIDFTKTKRKRKRKAKSEDDDLGDMMDGGEDGELELKLPYYVKKFVVAKDLLSKKPTEYMEFSDTEEKELYMHMDFIQRMIPDSNDEMGEFLYIPLEDIPQEEFIFMVDVLNNELTKPMKSIQKVLNNKSHEGCNTYEEVVNKMLDLMIASKLDAMSVHSEMIIRELVRSNTNVLKRPDFSRIIMSQDYQLLTIGTALKENPAICTSLSTPYLKDQLISLTDTFNKDAQSVFDPLFRLTLTDE